MTNQELQEILLLSKKIENAILRVINNSESLSPGEKARVGEMLVNRRHWSATTVFSRLPKAQRDEIDNLVELLSDTIDMISR
jgi:hypothetical protein